MFSQKVLPWKHPPCKQAEQQQQDHIDRQQDASPTNHAMPGHARCFNFSACLAYQFLRDFLDRIFAGGIVVVSSLDDLIHLSLDIALWHTLLFPYCSYILYLIS
jgi:hypothetical protein